MKESIIKLRNRRVRKQKTPPEQFLPEWKRFETKKINEILSNANSQNLSTTAIPQHKNTILVGNGPSAGEGGRGKLVDQFSTVVRFNQFDIKKYSHSVGLKTSIWVLNAHCCTKLLSTTIKKIAEFKSYGYDVETFMLRSFRHFKLMKEHIKQHFPNSSISIIPKSIVRETTPTAPFPRKPTTGLLVLSVLLKTSKTPIYLHGFDHVYGTPGHYNDDLYSKTHNIHEEQLYYCQLIKDERIKIL